jgi:isopenicillin-N N-acyltransferase like protein
MIPLVRAAGTHAAAGAIIGTATAEALRRRAERIELDTEFVLRYRAPSVKYLPWVVEELDAVAAAAEIDPLVLFAGAIEELNAAAMRETAPIRCTDIAAGPTLTADGHVLVGHNNDLTAGEEDDVVAIEWRVEDEPTIFTLGTGPWISVGWNDAGLSVTGNEVAPKDEGIGIPRLLQVRDALTRRTLPEAVKAILHPARASSYNWVVGQGDYVASLEGSATTAETLTPSEDGALVHTNHYVHPEMLDYEAGDAIEGSATRLRRAHDLASGLSGEPMTKTRLRQILSDHENAPDSLCRHAHGDGEPQTAFWCVADVTARTVMYGRGNPCQSEPQLYAFT